MKSYIINRKKYYNADELKNHYPKIFKGCKTGRTFVNKNCIVERDYIYACKDNNYRWKKSDSTSRNTDKIFILVDWFEENYLNESDECDECNERDENIIEEAPEIIELSDSEKFLNNDGDIIKIEVRGKRKVNKCYFKVKDVAEGFDLPNLHTNIIKNKSGFENNEHYKYFYLQIEGDSVNSPKHQKNETVGTITPKHQIKKLYLTYFGLLRVLFASHKKTTNKFINWATETLFTSHMGSLQQKSKLVANILGVPMEAVREVLSKTTNKISCNYLISIGRVKNLRKAFDISKKYDDDDYVYKYGMSDDLKRRIGEIKSMFKNISGIKVELVIFNYIDPQFISEAETRVKNIMNNYGLKLVHEEYTELAIIPKGKINFIKEQYDTIAKIYRGNTLELTSQLKELELTFKLKELALTSQLKEKDYIIKEKDYIIQSFNAQREIEKLKMQLQSSQHIVNKNMDDNLKTQLESCQHIVNKNMDDKLKMQLKSSQCVNNKNMGDNFKNFMDELFEITQDATDQIDSSYLYDMYLKFSERNSQKCDQSEFKKRLKKEYNVREKKCKAGLYFYGIAMRTEI